MRRALALVVLALGIFAGTAGSASAADELGLSPDGVTWAATLPGPIFDPAFRWVPGDSEIGTFYVRNQSTDDGVLGLTMQAAEVTDLIETGDLTVSARVDGGAWNGVTTAGPHDLITDESVPAGAVRKVEVKVDFDPASDNQSEEKVLDLGFTVSLHQAAEVSGPGNGNNGGNGGSNNGSGNNGSGNGSLPNTGSDIRPWMFLVSGLSIAFGVILARRASTKERTHHG
jgi:LPXTG-motif cell wall-anchored protein